MYVFSTEVELSLFLLYSCRKIEAVLSGKLSQTSLMATDQTTTGEDGEGFRWNTTGDQQASTGSTHKAGHISLGTMCTYACINMLHTYM